MTVIECAVVEVVFTQTSFSFSSSELS